MILNIIFGFIIPWLTMGMYLYKKDKKIIFYIIPFASLVAFGVNLFGYTLNLFHLEPLELGILSTFPTNLGYFPLLGGLFIYSIRASSFNNKLKMILFSILSSALEYNFVISGKIVYSENWNIFFTFLSYLLAYTVGYYYYIALIHYF